MLQTNTSAKNITRIWTEYDTGACAKPQRAAEAAGTSEEGKPQNGPATRCLSSLRNVLI